MSTERSLIDLPTVDHQSMSRSDSPTLVRTDTQREKPVPRQQFRIGPNYHRDYRRNDSVYPLPDMHAVRQRAHYNQSLVW